MPKHLKKPIVLKSLVDDFVYTFQLWCQENQDLSAAPGDVYFPVFHICINLKSDPSGLSLLDSFREMTREVLTMSLPTSFFPVPSKIESVQVVDPDDRLLLSIEVLKSKILSRHSSSPDDLLKSISEIITDLEGLHQEISACL